MSQERKENLRTGMKEFFEEIGLDLRGLKILDVGIGHGHHADIMRSMGANVWGIDPLPGRLKEIFHPDRVIKERIQQLPDKFKEKFDLVTAFRIHPNDDDLSGFYKGISSALKPNGKAIIGIDRMALNNFLDGHNDNLLNLHFNIVDKVYEQKEYVKNWFKIENEHIYIVYEPREISKAPEKTNKNSEQEKIKDLKWLSFHSNRGNIFFNCNASHPERRFYISGKLPELRDKMQKLSVKLTKQNSEFPGKDLEFQIEDLFKKFGSVEIFRAFENMPQKLPDFIEKMLDSLHQIAKLSESHVDRIYKEHTNKKEDYRRPYKDRKPRQSPSKNGRDDLSRN